MEINFLLEITWANKIYRFANTTISVNGDLYIGGLSDINIEQTTNYTDISIEQNAVSIELTFLDIDWVKQWLEGRSIVNSQCNISMYYNDIKEYVFFGYAKDPIFGVPDKPPGYITFSIDPKIESKKFLAISSKIDVYQFPGLDQRVSALGRFIQYPIGKYIPFAFGAIGTWQKATVRLPTTKIGLDFLTGAKCTPVYAIDAVGTGGSILVTYILCLGKTQATRIRVYDQTGGNFLNLIHTNTNEDGVIYSYTTYEQGHVIEDNAFFPAMDEDQTFWAAWGEYGEVGMDPLTKESLGPAGNLCMYVLSVLGVKYNLNAWLGVKNILNRYRFAGYINDGEIYTMDWWITNIVKFLPITIIVGSEGIEPKLNVYYYSRDQILPRYYIIQTGMFKQITALQPLDLQVTNKLTINYCYEAQNEHYLTSYTIDPTLPPNAADHPLKQRDPISDISYTRYGLSEEVIDLPFVWDYDTAQRIAKDYIRLRALGAYAIEIQAAAAYVYLQIGDIIAYTNTDIGLINYKCQIISKSWQNTAWHFVLQLENNTMVNPREI